MNLSIKIQRNDNKIAAASTTKVALANRNCFLTIQQRPTEVWATCDRKGETFSPLLTRENARVCCMTSYLPRAKLTSSVNQNKLLKSVSLVVLCDATKCHFRVRTSSACFSVKTTSSRVIRQPLKRDEQQSADQPTRKEKRVERIDTHHLLLSSHFKPLLTRRKHYNIFVLHQF